MTNSNPITNQKTSAEELLEKGTIPFELFPLVLSLILNDVCKIKSMLQTQTELTHIETDDLLTIKEASKLLGLSVPTLYSKVSRREIPFSKPNGTKQLYFSKSELLDFIKTGRVKTTVEVFRDADIKIKGKGVKNGK